MRNLVHQFIFMLVRYKKVKKKVMSGLHAVTLSILLIFVPRIIGNQSCSLDTCDTNGSTIVVNASDGGFCNRMSNMMALIYLKLVYQMQIFLPLDHYNILASVFPQIHARPAEKYIPGFEEKYQEFLWRQRAHKNKNRGRKGI